MAKKNQIHQSAFIDKSAQIVSSTLEKNCKIFRFSKVDHSELNVECVVGDMSRSIHSMMGVFTKIDRFSLLYFSSMDNYSYAGAYDMLMHTNIGKFCAISWGVTIGPSEHDFSRITNHDFLYNETYGIKIDGKVEAYDRFKKTSKVGNDVWVGANSTILRGVIIGDGAVIGANSIVTKDVPPYAIVAGNPAKIIKFRFDELEIKNLLELKWWEFPIEIIEKYSQLFSGKDVQKLIDTLGREK